GTGRRPCRRARRFRHPESPAPPQAGGALRPTRDTGARTATRYAIAAADPRDPQTQWRGCRPTLLRTATRRRAVGGRPASPASARWIPAWAPGARPSAPRLRFYFFFNRRGRGRRLRRPRYAGGRLALPHAIALARRLPLSLARRQVLR